jgi:hypothetical protein
LWNRNSLAEIDPHIVGGRERILDAFGSIFPLGDAAAQRFDRGHDRLGIDLGEKLLEWRAIWPASATLPHLRLYDDDQRGLFSRPMASLP